MRVLYWTERFWPHIGGIEILSLQLLSGLRDLGYEFAVVTSHSGLDLPDQAVYDDIPIYRFHFLTSLTNRNLKQIASARQMLARLKQTFKPDLVNIHFSGPSTYFHMQTVAAHPAPTLITIHSIPNNLSENSRLLIDSLRSADWIAVVSKTLLPEIQKLVPEIASRASVIYNGVQMPSIQPEPLPFDPPRLLCIGRLVRWKGFHLALTAFRSVIEHYPKACLIIAGDGPERSNLECLATELGVQNSVRFTGWIKPENVPELINWATMVIVPSLDSGGETLPVVAVQAQQIGRPVVATSVAGLPEIIVHEKTGLLVQQNDKDGLVEAIIYLLESPKLAKQMGRAGRRQVQDLFSLNRYVDAYDRLYKNLINDFGNSHVNRA